MNIIDINNMSISFGTEKILDGISFGLPMGAKLGIIGVNGSGKTTLFRAICGLLPPDEGSVSKKKDIQIGFLEQMPESSVIAGTVYEAALTAFKPLLASEKRLEELHRAVDSGDERAIERFTALNEHFIEEGGLTFRARTRSFLTHFGFNDNMQEMSASLLSGGEKTRLLLAKLLLSEPELILLDEPTNHLDIESIAWLEEYISKSKSSYMIISHDRYFLDRISTHTLEIEHCKGQLYSGSYSTFREKKDKLREDALKAYNLQQKEIARIEGIIEQQRRWGREKNIKTAESKQKSIDRMERLSRPEDKPKSISFAFQKSTSASREVLTVKNLSKAFPGKQLFSNISFDVLSGERIFIVGANGTGKSTLLKILIGELPADDGLFEFGYNQKVVYFDQEQKLLKSEKTAFDEISDEYSDMPTSRVRALLARFGFYGDDVFKTVSVLSGGERARLTIAKFISEGASVLILDEPTNHLDIPSKETLEAALSQYDGTIICVSHDRYFVSSQASKIILLHPDGSIRIFKEGYEEYQAHLNSPAGRVVSRNTDATGRESYNLSKKEKNKRRTIDTRLEKSEKMITAKEKELAEMTALLDASINDYEKYNEYLELTGKISEEIEELYSEYFLLEEEKSIYMLETDE